MLHVFTRLQGYVVRKEILDRVLLDYCTKIVYIVVGFEKKSYFVDKKETLF